MDMVCVGLCRISGAFRYCLQEGACQLCIQDASIRKACASLSAGMFITRLCVFLVLHLADL